MNAPVLRPHNDLPSVEHIVATTQFTDPKRAAAARDTLAWLEAGAPHKLPGVSEPIVFGMAEYISEDLNDCGSSCCIAGAITQIEIADKADRAKYIERVDFYDEFDLFKNRDLNQLFLASGSDYAPACVGWPNLENISVGKAARTLRHYLTTGIVDWALPENGEAA